MAADSNITLFLHHLKRYVQRDFSYPSEIEELLNLVLATNQTQAFEDLIFQAKFAVKTQEVMNRVGPGSEGFEKLASEFQRSVNESVVFIRKLIETSERKTEFSDKFLQSETESFSNLLKFLSDLSWIKNWQVDGKPLPYEKSFLDYISKSDIENSPAKIEKIVQSGLTIVRLQRSTVLCSILMILLLFIDPPVSILGWILSLGILGLLVYIVLELFSLNKYKKP